MRQKSNDHTRIVFRRRDFLKSIAAGVACVSCGRLSGNAVRMSCRRPVFHTRHIPIEHLNLETAMGRDVVRNGLCDTIKPDVLKQMLDFGVTLVEMRVVWWEIEPESGRFDWSRTLRDMDTVLNSGLKVGMFAWFHYPPAWYDPEHKNHARFLSVDGSAESSVLSLWDPKTIEVYDRLLGISTGALKGRVSFVYNSISGTYGEVDYGVNSKHYRFSSPAGGCLFGDRCARASFAAALRRQYGSVDALNAAWGAEKKSFDDDLMPKRPFADNPLKQRDDCMQWATGSLLDFADRVCGLYRKHYPGVAGGLPLGHVRETMGPGQIKSLAAKLAAKHGLTARWTGCAHLKSFDRSNLLARRIASAAHFYGASFGTEAALILEKENAANGLYESLANGAALVHDDPQNILRAPDVHKQLRPGMVVDPPDAPVTVFYPVEDDLLCTDGFSWETLVDRCAVLRRITDYNVCDSYMIADDYLGKTRDLVFPVRSHLREETAKAVIRFAARGGRVWFFSDADPVILHQTVTFAELADREGVTIRGPEQVGKAGMYRFSEWQQLAGHVLCNSFSIPDGGEFCFRTMHGKHESCYFPGKARFEVRPRKTSAD